MGRINSKAKGKFGELNFVHLLRERGLEARRGQQFSGSPDSPDVVCEALNIHWEVKNTEKLKIYDAMDQAKRDCAQGKHPVVAHKKNRKEWLAILPMEDFLDIMQTLKELESK